MHICVVVYISQNFLTFESFSNPALKSRTRMTLLIGDKETVMKRNVTCPVSGPEIWPGAKKSHPGHDVGMGDVGLGMPGRAQILSFSWKHTSFSLYACAHRPPWSRRTHTTYLGHSAWFLPTPSERLDSGLCGYNHGLRIDF